MTVADDRIRVIFMQLTDHFMKTGNLGLAAAKLTAAACMLKQARQSLISGKGQPDIDEESDGRRLSLSEIPKP